MSPRMAALLTLIALGACSQAAPSAKGGDAPAGRDGRRSADANHDGKVTLDEAKAAQKRMFDRFDTNHDGKLSFEEIEAMPERMADRMDRMDANGDRDISADEIAKAAEDRFHRRDKNGDGVLSGDEMRFGRERDSTTGGPASTPL
jgi:hypothetical protein